MEKIGGWEKVGTVGVDAGLIWVGDPCYCVTPDCSSHPAPNWQEFCKRLGEREVDGVSVWGGGERASGDGIGVAVSSGYGDGEYDVFVRRERGRGGRIAEVKVVFITEDEYSDGE